MARLILKRVLLSSRKSIHNIPQPLITKARSKSQMGIKSSEDAYFGRKNENENKKQSASQKLLKMETIKGDIIQKLNRLTEKKDLKTLEETSKESDCFHHLVALWFKRLSSEITKCQAEFREKKTLTIKKARFLLLNSDELSAIFLSSVFKVFTLEETKSYYKINETLFCSLFGNQIRMAIDRKYREFRKRIHKTDKQKSEREILLKKHFVSANIKKDNMDDFIHKLHDKISKEIGRKILEIFEKIAFTWIKSPDGFKKVPALKLVTERGKKSFFKSNRIILSSEFTKMAQKNFDFVFEMQCDDVDFPMDTLPLKWVDVNNGGFTSIKKPLMRIKVLKPQYKAILETVPTKELDYLFECVNKLQKCAWKINEKVFNVVRHFYENGLGISGIPKRLKDKPDKSDKMEFLLKNKKHFKAEEFYDLLSEKVMETSQSWNEWKDHYNSVGIYATFSLKYFTVKKFLKKDIYFPYFLDFRGRCYPYSRHFNHIGDDLSRGLLKYSKAKSLNMIGWKWLLIHFANMYGIDKVSNEERFNWGENNVKNAIKSAENPLKHRWWVQGSEPWQVLACCFEINDAVSSPCKYSFKSSLPIYQDGSCNGLQHYSAIALDPEGAECVNLIPSSKPQDAYLRVLKRVKDSVNSDIDSSKNSLKRKLAEKAMKCLNRKMVKQTVMTSVYGVTMRGAREQIDRQIKRAGIDFSEEPFERFELSLYLATVVMNSVKNVFASAYEVMDWLKKCATIISSTGQPVTWMTPLGLPALQDYGFNPALYGKRFKLDIIPSTQSLPFPPNFIHSFDSTHMLMTAHECEKKKIVFSSVHDSFWTHAADVPLMGEILRKCFVDLHTEDHLMKLYRQFKVQFPLVGIPPPPKRGNLDLSLVLSSEYFFS